MSASAATSYYRLVKPGIIRGNAVTAAAGFFLASTTTINWSSFAAMMVGLALIIGASCVANNYIDRDIDRKMERTKKRALVTQEISTLNAFIYCLALGITGSLVLGFLTGSLALYLALAGVFFYVVVYGVAKRLSPLGTLVGSISGAIPPLVGYAAASGKLDLAAIILFLILVTWQMPHFYAIAMYRIEDYKRAGIPVLPVEKGMSTTKKHILFYCQLYLFAALALSVFGYTGYVYFGVAALLGIVWIWLAMKGFKATSDEKWAKLMFRYSLLNLSLLCLVIYFGRLLP